MYPLSGLRGETVERRSLGGARLLVPAACGPDTGCQENLGMEGAPGVGPPGSRTSTRFSACLVLARRATWQSPFFGLPAPRDGRCF